MKHDLTGPGSTLVRAIKSIREWPEGDIEHILKARDGCDAKSAAGRFG